MKSKILIYTNPFLWPVLIGAALGGMLGKMFSGAKEGLKNLDDKLEE